MKRTGRGNNIAATTRDLRAIARDAHKLGLNRQLLPAQFKLLDPRGTHILTPQFMHDRADGKPIDPHLRCHIHIKLLGKQKSVERLIDVPFGFITDLFDDEFIAEMIEKGEAVGAVTVNDPEREEANTDDELSSRVVERRAEGNA